MAKVHRHGIWYSDIRFDALCYVPPGFYEETVYPEPTIMIPHEAIAGLITVLDELGLIKPRLDERLRQEDLRITHRVLDLLEKAVGPPVVIEDATVINNRGGDR